MSLWKDDQISIIILKMLINEQRVQIAHINFRAKFLFPNDFQDGKPHPINQMRLKVWKYFVRIVVNWVLNLFAKCKFCKISRLNAKCLIVGRYLPSTVV